MTLPRWNEQYPPEELTPPVLRPLFAEHAELTARLRAAELHLESFNDEAQAAAMSADADARADAVRAGASAASVGSPHVERYEKDRAAAQVEFETLDAVHTDSLNKIQTVITEDVLPDDRLSGRAAIETARGKYRKSIAAMLKARDEFTATTAVPAFLQTCMRGVGGPTANYRTANLHRELPEPPRNHDPQTKREPVANRAALETWLYVDADTTATKEYQP